ncbi:hypothetical protein [Georgenia wangjunii]|uniref:hypothetical protein n=1 Tax=Georgenia wangjunii TaxID=3117730 RepID=UPI002F2697C0
MTEQTPPIAAAVAATEAPPTSAADDLNQEPVEVGKRLLLRFKGQEFTLPDVAHDRPWREVTKILANLGGERGALPLEKSFDELFGAQMTKTVDWNFADFSEFASQVATRIGASVGSAGE